MSALDSLIKQAINAPDGPILAGMNKALSSGSAVPKLAALYAGAFKSAKRTLPYFTAEEERAARQPRVELESVASEVKPRQLARPYLHRPPFPSKRPAQR